MILPHSAIIAKYEKQLPEAGITQLPVTRSTVNSSVN